MRIPAREITDNCIPKTHFAPPDNIHLNIKGRINKLIYSNSYKKKNEVNNNQKNII